MPDFSKDFFELCRASLILHEGKRNRVYLDTEENPTIAVGFNLKRRDAADLIRSLGCSWKGICSGQDELTEEQIDKLLEIDIQRCCRELDDCKFEELSVVRRLVLVDMIFNLGLQRFLGFRKMIAAVNAKDWAGAAREMLDSRWAKQVGARALRLSGMMESGELSGEIEGLVSTATAVVKKTAAVKETAVGKKKSSRASGKKKASVKKTAAGKKKSSRAPGKKKSSRAPGKKKSSRAPGKKKASGKKKSSRALGK